MSRKMSIEEIRAETTRLHDEVLQWSRTEECIEGLAYDKAISEPASVAIGMIEDLLHDMSDRGYNIAWTLQMLAYRMYGQSENDAEREMLAKVGADPSINVGGPYLKNL